MLTQRLVIAVVVLVGAGLNQQQTHTRKKWSELINQLFTSGRTDDGLAVFDTSGLVPIFLARFEFILSNSATCTQNQFLSSNLSTVSGNRHGNQTKLCNIILLVTLFFNYQKDDHKILNMPADHITCCSLSKFFCSTFQSNSGGAAYKAQYDSCLTEEQSQNKNNVDRIATQTDNNFAAAGHSSGCSALLTD